MRSPTAAPAAAAQTEETKPAFGITLSGFVKTDIFYDTRQTVAVREGHYLLYPKAPLIGPDGDDVNDRAGFHMLSIQTRIAGKITGEYVASLEAKGKPAKAFYEALLAELAAQSK